MKLIDLLNLVEDETDVEIFCRVNDKLLLEVREAEDISWKFVRNYGEQEVVGISKNSYKLRITIA